MFKKLCALLSKKPEPSFPVEKKDLDFFDIERPKKKPALKKATTKTAVKKTAVKKTVKKK